MENRVEKYIRYTLIVLAIVLLALLVFFVTDYRLLRHGQMIHQGHMPLPVSEAGGIRTWMTFDYVNKLFALPPDYLQTQLHISDARYPRLTISSYAKSMNLDPAAMLNEVEGVVRNHS